MREASAGWSVRIISDSAQMRRVCDCTGALRSVAAEAFGRLNGLRLGEVEIADVSQRVRRCCVLEIIGQSVEPCRLVLLQREQFRDGLSPTLCSAPMICRAPDASGGQAARPNRAITRLAFGIGQGILAG